MRKQKQWMWQHFDYMLIMLISGLSILLISMYGERTHQASYDARQIASEQLLARGGSVCQDITVIDGDTIYATCEREAISVRLLGIDAPEMGQIPYGQMAKDALQARLSTSVYIEFHGLDYYQRTLGVLYNQDENLNLTLVKLGFVVAYDSNSTDAKYVKAEQVAKEAKLGIWAQPGFQQNPKQWRRYH